MSAPTTDDPTGTHGPDGTTAYRLPTSVRPHAYRLVLTPDLPAATFAGDIEIDVTVEAPTPSITLNAAELEITFAELNDGNPDGGYALAPTAVDLDPDEERATLTFSEPLMPGPATLHLAFTGILNDKLHGFYRSTFTDEAGVDHTIATTQMESTDARRAFPCWDEPDLKATFEITLVVDEALAAYSNGSVVEESPEPDGKRRVRFAPTMVMSTYLVAFIVGPLEATDPVDVNGVPLRIVHPPGKGVLTPFALAVGAHALNFFTDYFGIPYPADKLDLVAIPDFAFGAMENLGCVTFRESVLLVDPAQAARVELERVADVICHEVAHMWFGDLVTMKWWNGIWLNEAFATFMEVLAVDAFRPEWQRWVSFGVEREAAMAVDGLHATRPVEFPVGRPEEAQGMFDVLTYQKGGSVLRMLEQFVGPDVFREGINDYLTTHRYGNTETSDLWDALERSSGRAVRTIMDTWINQGGYPLVRVGDDGSLAQTPFSYRGDPGGAIGSRWQIPVLTRWLDGDSEDPLPVLLAGPTGRTDGDGGAGPCVVNAGGSGYFRVAYTTAAVERLAGRLADLEPLERYNLVSDTWAAALSGQAPLADVLRLARALVDSAEGDPSVWSVVLGALGLFDRVVADLDRPVLAQGIRALLGPLARDLGWDPRDDDGERTPSLRASVLRTLGTIGDDPDIQAEAARRFAAAGSSALHPDTESAVLDIVAFTGGVSEYEVFLSHYRSPVTPQEENRYLYALASFTDLDLASRTFDLAMSEVRTQNAPFVLQSLVANRVTGPTAWQRITDDWDAVVAKFPSNILPRMLEGVRGLCAPPELAARVTDFVEAHPLPAGGKTVEQILERLAVNVAFGEREGRSLAATLAEALGLPLR
ncbi:MAG TPA: M1 family metallopeptidase [Acidimicrobiales bacterium]|jgi:puromycin-sensitive aminopeptidase|nr:M1 family metallopeptidase [Acidimicrobiales bacterium]